MGSKTAAKRKVQKEGDHWEWLYLNMDLFLTNMSAANTTSHQTLLSYSLGVPVNTETYFIMILIDSDFDIAATTTGPPPLVAGCQGGPPQHPLWHALEHLCHGPAAPPPCDSTMQMSHDYSEELNYRSSQSELISTLN